ncbi:MAG: hypothetical protein C5B51_16820 [Terriglobia bacterium]|nr:MAG: hypothetical protein C5B51_16820 [Terriglobia bacterium]
MKMRICLIGTFLAFAAGLVNAQTWTQAKWPIFLAPQARFGSAFTYDTFHQNSPLFGGVGASNLGPLTLGDTWMLTPAGWRKLSPVTSPSPRFGMMMGWDYVKGQGVMFGGGYFANNGVLFKNNETWVWDGTTWTQKFPANSPSPRYLHVMVYDGARNQTVLFGGVTDAGYVADTWIWNGTTWTQVFPAHSPSPRAGGGFTYDATRNVSVLFGGVTPVASQSDTWIWNGTDWVQLFPATVPPPRYAQGFQYDGAQNQSIMFGGTNEGGINLSDTWAWNGSNWVQQFPALIPTKRFYTQMTYDYSQGKLGMFGGGEGIKIGDVYLADTWLWF